MTTTALPSRKALIAGRVLSGLVIAFLLFDAGLKLVAPQFAIDNSPPSLGWKLDIATMRTLAILLLIPTLLHIWPRTAVPRRDPDHRLSRRRRRHPCAHRQPAVQPYLVRRLSGGYDVGRPVAARSAGPRADPAADGSRAMSFQAYLDNVEAKTGKSPDELKAIAADKGLADGTENGGLAPGIRAGQIIDWLKADYGLGHGHAMSIVAWIKGKRS